MSSRKRPRKAEQQRLTFEPVAAAESGSSPIPGLGLSPARVRFSSPRAAQQASPSRRPPATSSPLRMGGTKKKPRQQTLESSLGKEKVKKASKKPAPDEDEDSDNLPLVPSSSASKVFTEARRRRAAPPAPRSSVPQSSIFATQTDSHRLIVLDSDSESPVEEVGGVSDSDGEGPLRQEDTRKSRQTRAPVPAVIISSDEQDEDSENDVQVNARSSQSLPNPVDADDDDDADELPIRAPRSSKPNRGRLIIDSDDEADEEDEVRPSTRMLKTTTSMLASVDSESEDEGLFGTPKNEGKGKSKAGSRRRRPITDSDNDDDEEENIRSPIKKRKITRTIAAPANSESEGEGLFGTPKKKGKGKGKRKSKSALSKGDSSPVTSTARIMRSGGRRHRSVREKKMELLKRRKAGEKDLTLEDLDTDEGDDRAEYDTNSDNEVLQVFEDDESEPEETAAATKKAKKAKKKALKKAAKRQRSRETSVADEDADSDDDAFIDDDDDIIGVPDEALHLMPLEFTRSAIKPLKEHFKDAVAWLVHRKINPGFDKKAEVYVRAWQKLSDEITGLANSKFISSVWKPDFHKSLKARPYLDQKMLGIGSIANPMESCQACGRSGHPATWSIRPYGKPYDPWTLDEVESDSEDEDDEDEGNDRDFHGNTIEPATKEFYVGQTCNSNAETAHTLMHWKIGLRDWVDSKLDEEGLFAEDQILEREQMRAKQRNRMAEEIVARWHEHRVVSGLFGNFQQLIENARNKDTTKVSRGRRH